MGWDDYMYIWELHGKESKYLIYVYEMQGIKDLIHVQMDICCDPHLHGCCTMS